MTKTRLWLATVAASLLAVALDSGLARACSPYACSQAGVFPGGGSLPEDLVRFRVQHPFVYGNDAGTVNLPRLYREEAGVRTELTLKVTSGGVGVAYLEAADALAVGTQLVMTEDGLTCYSGEPIPERRYVVTAKAAAPNELGMLQAIVRRGPLEVQVHGLCSDVVDTASAELQVTLSAGAVPFADVLQREVWVDGAPWMGGTERVYAVCAPDPVVRFPGTLGKHRALVRATLPDGTRLETPEVAFELRCSGPVYRYNDAGVALGERPGGDGGANSDGAASDGGVSRENSTSDGCSLATRGSAAPAAPALPAIGVAAALLTRRRRRGER